MEKQQSWRDFVHAVLASVVGTAIYAAVKVILIAFL